MEDADVIRFLVSHAASELWLKAGHPPRLRARDGVRAMDLPDLDARAVREFVESLLNERERREFQAAGVFSRERKWPNRERGLRIQAAPDEATFLWETGR